MGTILSKRPDLKPHINITLPVSDNMVVIDSSPPPHVVDKWRVGKLLASCKSQY